MRRFFTLLLAATALAWAFGLGLSAWGVLLGVACFAALLAARRPMPPMFGALALGAALSFAIMAAILGHLAGVSVLEMLAAEGHWIGSALAVLALAFAALGIASLAWAALSRGQAGRR